MPEFPVALKAAITEHRNAHNLASVMGHGAPETEYDPEMEDFTRPIGAGETITPEPWPLYATSGSARDQKWSRLRRR